MQSAEQTCYVLVTRRWRRVPSTTTVFVLRLIRPYEKWQYYGKGRDLMKTLRAKKGLMTPKPVPRAGEDTDDCAALVVINWRRTGWFMSQHQQVIPFEYT